MSLQKRLTAIERLTPKTGFNVVGVDEFESDPELELFLIGEFKTEAEAKKALAAFKKRSPDTPAYIYGSHAAE